MSSQARRLLIASFWTLFLGLGAVAAAVFLETREEYLRLQHIEKGLETRVADAEAQLATLQTQSRRLQQDPRYVDGVIRKKLGYARPDEWVFRFEQ